MKLPGVEMAKYRKGDRIRFCVEGEVEHILDSDTEVGRITYILDNGFVLLASERDKGSVRIIDYKEPRLSMVQRLISILRAVWRL